MERVMNEPKSTKGKIKDYELFVFGKDTRRKR